MAFRDSLLSSWQKPTLLTYALIPFGWVYRTVYAIRKLCYRIGIFSSYKADMPVIVVGNLTVGGTGKTPLVIYLVELLRSQGYTPAVISRGYSGDAPIYPLEVTPSTPVDHSGDEPALIVKRTKVPMAVGPNRRANIELLMTNHKIDIVISDDGLQHLALQRDIEVCLVDDTVVVSNAFLLPAGPYREPVSRLQTVDLIVHHQSENKDVEHGRHAMFLKASAPKLLNAKLEDEGQGKQLSSGDKVHAVAGIGNPQRFFKTCKLEGYRVVEHVFPDHHHFKVSDLEFNDSLPVLMTEKDAVKCRQFDSDNYWYLPVDAQLTNDFSDAIIKKIDKVI